MEPNERMYSAQAGSWLIGPMPYPCHLTHFTTQLPLDAQTIT
jgi:hypothetical protein